MKHEILNDNQRENYVASDIQEDLVDVLIQRFGEINSVVLDCQERMPYVDGHFDRILVSNICQIVLHQLREFSEFVTYKKMYSQWSFCVKGNWSIRLLVKSQHNGYLKNDITSPTNGLFNGST